MSDNSSLVTKHLQKLGAVLRLRGPAQNDPTARILHILVVGLLIFLIIENAIVAPLISPKNSRMVASFNLLNLLTFAATLVLLRHGIVRLASLVYVAGTWLLTTALIVLTGGINSIGLVVYVTLPISAAGSSGTVRRYGRRERAWPPRWPAPS